MPSEWHQLRNETMAAQVSFLDAEATTGMTLARIALKANDPDKVLRNAVSARKAYDTIISHLSDLPAKTPGLEELRKKLATLERLLHSLAERR